MATPSLAHPAHPAKLPTTRVERGLRLYEEHGHEIEMVAPEIYLVPSSDGERTYRVDYRNEFCSCPDAGFHPEETCKHVFAVGISRAKRRRQAKPSAREEFLRHDLASPLGL